MRCTSPRTVGFKHDGRTISWSNRSHSKEYATFQLPCGQCIECRLDYARQWAIRCVHEAQMHPHNCFVTLTYEDQKLLSPQLQYVDFQKFMRRLRKTQPHTPIGVFVTGEYGEQTKRPHWHAILFNYRPRDCVEHYKTQLGHQVYTAESLTALWGHGHAEIGTVTIESAGYVARYAAKKLCHGHDSEKYKPISKKSSKHAIGKKWLEKFWPDIFNHGYTILLSGTKTGVPRYYEKWLQKNQPERWNAYVTEIKLEKATKAQFKSEQDAIEYRRLDDLRRHRDGLQHVPIMSRSEASRIISEKKFKEALQKYNKL